MVQRIGLALVLSLASIGTLSADDWPQWMGPKRDGVWREASIVDKFPENGPKIKWRIPIRSGYAGPAVANGKVYLADYVTSASIEGDPNKRPKLDGEERLLCFDAEDGKLIWEHKYKCKYSVSYPAGPRCTPTVHDGKVYSLGTEGNLYCLSADKGEVLWSKDFKADYGVKTPIWGFCGHPLVDGQKLLCVVGGEGAVAVAFDKDTGKEIWKALTAKEPGYAPPSIIEAGGKRQLLIWHPESINSLDPETGKRYWTVPLEPAYGMSIMAPRKYEDYLFAGGIGFKAVMLKLATDKPAATEIWRGKKETGVYPVNSTPHLEDGIIYGVDQPGILRAVKIETGERLWETSSPVIGKETDRGLNSGTAFLVKNGDRYFLFNELGQLIIARLSPKGYEEISKAKVIEPSNTAFGRDIVWSHPAFANKCAYIRNDKELICVDLAK